MARIDFHSHILPGMDDGSRSVEESLAMLRASAAYGVSTMVAAPHFYARHESPEAFLARRTRALAALDAARTAELPAVIPAAEVYFFAGMSAVDALDRLCIGDSRFLLLEMPFEPWSRSVVQEVIKLIHMRQITPVLAHIERYLKFQRGTERLDELLSCGALAQMNAACVNGWRTRRSALRMIRDERVHLLGSDCHNMADRRPDLGAAYAVIERKLGRRTTDRIDDLGTYILKQT